MLSESTKYYSAGSARVAMRKAGVVTYLFGDHLGSTSVAYDDAADTTRRQGYTVFGTERYNLGGDLPTRYQFTGQRGFEEIGLQYYGARWYDGALGRFSQADTIIPEPGNPMAWDRYSYARNSPVMYTDPTGHAYCASHVPGAMCMNDNPDPVYYSPPPTTSPIPAPVNATTASTPSIAPSIGGPACSGANWSIVCVDPTLVSSGQVQTNTVFPVSQTPEAYNGPYVDEKCIVPWVCALLLAADAAHYVRYQTNLPAHFTNRYVVANINYELHTNQIGYYTFITSVQVSNNTDVSIYLQSITIGNYQYKPDAPLVIPPGSTLIKMSPLRIPGKSASISLFFQSETYSVITLNAAY